MVTWSISTQLVIRTPEPILQCGPTADRLIDDLAPTCHIRKVVDAGGGLGGEGRLRRDHLHAEAARRVGRERFEREVVLFRQRGVRRRVDHALERSDAATRHVEVRLPNSEGGSTSAATSWRRRRHGSGSDDGTTNKGGACR